MAELEEITKLFNDKLAEELAKKEKESDKSEKDIEVDKSKTDIDEKSPSVSNQQYPQQDIPKEAEKESYEKQITELKTAYEDKMQKALADKDKAIAERDNVIKQLLTGEVATPMPTIADKINAKRNYKKW